MSDRKQRRRGDYLFALLLLILATFAYALGWTSLFTVKEVRVSGAPTPTQSLLIRQSVPLGEKMARLEPRSVSNSLKKYNWLDHAQVTRNWLNGSVSIQVWTRWPVAVFRGKLIDRDGVLFDLPNHKFYSLPKILNAESSSAKLAIDLLVELPVDIRSEVIEVSTQGAHTAVFKIHSSLLKPPRNVTVIWGDLTDTALKVRVFKALLALPENAHVGTVNVSAPHAPIVK